MPVRRLKRGDPRELELGNRSRARSDLSRCNVSDQVQGLHGSSQQDEPQYELESDTPDLIALHTGSAMRKFQP